MVWTVIPDSDIDPDSPITTGLMTAYRDNFAALANGDSGAPEFSGVTGASRVLLSTQIASSSAQIDFTSDIDGTYDRYIIEMVNVVSSSNADYLYGRVFQSSIIKTDPSYSYSGARATQAGTVTGFGAGSVTQIELVSSQRNDIGVICNGTVYLSSPDNTTYDKSIYAQFTYAGSAENNVSAHVGGYYNSTSAIDGIRFYYGTGNIATGTFRLYGIKDS